MKHAVTFHPGDDRISFERNPAPGCHHFATEASTLFGPHELPVIIEMTVAASGNTRDFNYAAVIRDHEDVQAWVYATNDELPQMRLILFND